MFVTNVCSFGQQHVILISIDGLRPEMYRDKIWPTPNLQKLVKHGVYADHMTSVFPAYTYSSHTAMVTGALPARSGVYFNQPKGSKGDWYWYMDSMKVPTLWHVLKHQGQTTAAVQWPGSVTTQIDWNVPEIWDVQHPLDRITVARKYATLGLIESIEQYATGRLDSTNMRDECFCLDENTGRIGAYIFKTYRPNLLAIHFAEVDGMEHEYGRDNDSVRLALATVDRAIGNLLQAVQDAKLSDSTTVIVVGDHGFADIHTVIRPNIILQSLPNVPVKFIASGGSAFLYPVGNALIAKDVLTRVINWFEKTEYQKYFSLYDRTKLDLMGADSAALLALAAKPGIVFTSAVVIKSANTGPGTVIQNNSLDVVGTTNGGHHGYDPNLSEMFTGFIAAGTGIRKGSSIKELCVTDIAPLIAALLRIPFHAPDGKLPDGILLKK